MIKSLLVAAIHRQRQRRHAPVAAQVQAALAFAPATIPCFMVAYNNHSHLRSMLQQLNAKGISPIIFDNHSSCPVTQRWLHEVHQKNAYVVWVGRNLRHKVGFLPGIYEAMPETFAYSDPDLRLNPQLPENFLEAMAQTAHHYQVFKAGMALTLDAGPIHETLTIRFQKQSSMPFARTYTVREWESQYWRFPLQRDDGLAVYAADVDTTFAVYQKAHYKGKFTEGVRMAGPYSAIHLPWFVGMDTMDEAEKAQYRQNNQSSTWR